ncbi:MAG: hypothetical protein AAFV53_02990 [Myxococcota bacterium]
MCMYPMGGRPSSGNGGGGSSFARTWVTLEPANIDVVNDPSNILPAGAASYRDGGDGFLEVDLSTTSLRRTLLEGLSFGWVTPDGWMATTQDEFYKRHLLRITYGATPATGDWVACMGWVAFGTMTGVVSGWGYANTTNQFQVYEAERTAWSNDLLAAGRSPIFAERAHYIEGMGLYNGVTSEFAEFRTQISAQESGASPVNISTADARRAGSAINRSNLHIAAFFASRTSSPQAETLRVKFEYSIT